MYSQTGEQKIPFYKAIIITIALSLTIFTAAPQDADAFILAILGPIIAGSVVATIVFEAIIWCAIFCGGGGGGGGSTQVCTEADVGRSCDSSVECPNGDIETYASTIQWATGSPTGVNGDGLQTGECNCIVDGGLPVCTNVNYCGMGDGGAGVCGGCYDVANSAGGVLTNADAVTTTPPDSDCQFALTPDSLIITPEIARKGDRVTVTWNIGDNFPGNCSLTGANITDPFINAASLADPTTLGAGVINVTVTGPHHYELTCTGAGEIKKDLKLLPNIADS